MNRLKLQGFVSGALFFGSLWQIWEAFMAHCNGWLYAFPFKVWVGDPWVAMDFWIACLFLSPLILIVDMKT